MKVKIVLLCAWLSAVTMSGTDWAEETGDDMDTNQRTIVILHTNDLHGHLLAWKGWEGELKGKTIGGLDRLAGAIAQVRKEHGEAVLLLDAGDLIGDTMIADLTDGRAMIEALNHLGYDALAVGNHEPDFDMQNLRQRSKEAKFPLLATNLIGEDGKLFTTPYVVKRVDGVAVGVLGLAYPKTDRTTDKKNVEKVTFQDPVSSVKKFLPKMREEGAEVIIVLSHLGLSGDQELAKSVDGIHVIVGGHSHNRMAEAERAGTTLVVQAGAHGADLGRLDLRIMNGRIVAHRRTLIALDHYQVLSEPSAAKLVERLLKPHRQTRDEVVGKAGDWLVRAQTLAGQQARKRDEESPIDSLFADILRGETNADFALLPGVGYGVAIPPGPVTAAQLRQMVPHDGKIVTMRLTGAQVVEVLEQAVENVFTDEPQVKVGGMVQVAGLRFSYDPTQANGQRVWQVECSDGGWDATTRYLVVTNSMLAAGGHNYETFTQGKKQTDHGSQYETIRRWFGDHSPVVTPPLDRICQAPKSK